MDKQLKEKIGIIFDNAKEEAKNGNLDSAITHLSTIEEECGKLPQEQGVVNYLGGILNYKGSLLFQAGRFDEALTTLDKSLKLLENQKDSWFIGDCHHHLAKVFLKLKKLEDAEREALLSLQTSGETENLESRELSAISKRWGDLCDIHSAMGETEKAIEDEQKALDIRKNLADKDEKRLEDVAKAYIRLSSLYFDSKNDEEAKKNAVAALAAYEQIQTRGNKDCAETIGLLQKWLNTFDEC